VKDRNWKELLGKLDTGVLPSDEQAGGRRMLGRDIQARLAEAVGSERQAWQGVGNRSEWEAFRRVRLERLRGVLRGSRETWPGRGSQIRVTGELPGEGYRLRKLVYETQPEVLVTALLYLPDPIPERMPGIQICHAHHQPKEQGELQDMGVTWARSGCAVLAPDMLGHGERRQDQFGGRQGYYARYYEAMQLDLVGESLAGWMVADLMGGIDVLLTLPGIDAGRIVMLGAVAGGGDLAAMAAALDTRIACSVPFNFGAGSEWHSEPGMEPPVGRNLAKWPYWETTRALRRSACEQFFPWFIVAAAAPRHTIYAHEFAWAMESDESWARIKAVFDFYGAAERLGWQKGEGGCRPGPGNTHCTNVGPLHRAGLYPWLARWFGMPTPEEQSDRRAAEELACLDAGQAAILATVRTIAARQAAKQVQAVRRELDGLDGTARRMAHRRLWADVLGDVDAAPSAGEITVLNRACGDGICREHVLIKSEPGIGVPLLVLCPARDYPTPFVVGVAHEGKACFLKARASEIGRLLEQGIAVCLVDVRGTGETAPDDSHGLNSAFIDLSEAERMLGRNMAARQLRDLRAAVAYLRGRDDLDASRLALWGDSFAPVNPAGFVPGEHDRQQVDHSNWPNPAYGPHWAEPIGALLVLWAALFEDNVGAVLVRGGLASIASICEFGFFCIPSDAIVPGAMRAGDIAELAVSAACPVRLEGLVDACNRVASRETLDAQCVLPRSGNVALSTDLGPDTPEWLAAELSKTI
jgi:dienelactone hydrolase